MPIEKVIILGGGIAGIGSALALSKTSINNKLTATVYEIRDTPSTIGGAINLTPNALRYLDHIGVLPKIRSLGADVPYIEIFSHRNGAKLGILSFDKPERFGGVKAMRIQRGDLLGAMLETAKEAGIEVKYGKRAVEIDMHGVNNETGDGTVKVRFADGETTEGNLLLGCDGIHSFVRAAVQPDRKPVYSGIATAYGMFDDDENLKAELPFVSTGLWSGRLGSLMCSWVNPPKTKLYVAGVMETKDVESREGWKLRGADENAVKEDIKRRFKTPNIPYLEKMVDRVDAFFLYPVFKLPPHGIWSKGAAILLGDAAHAVSVH